MKRSGDNPSLALAMFTVCAIAGVLMDLSGLKWVAREVFFFATIFQVAWVFQIVMGRLK